ncbi:MAG: aspartyl protease family protein [Proteobacteria bacterium]|nr:aspartyl protease family protein [Pseudomonadota bacterium]
MLLSLIPFVLAQAAQPSPATPPFEARATTAAAPAPHPTETLATHRDERNRMTVDVRIGDKGPYRFLVDTGAQTTVMSSALVQRLGLPAMARRRVLGIAGQMEVDTVELPEIHLGRRTFATYVTPVLDEANLGADGIIGIDGLQGQRVLLDFRNQEITVTDSRGTVFESGFDIVVTARRRDGQLILTNADIDGVNTDVVLDTGAEQSIGNRALQQALARRQRGAAITLLSVTGQTIPADMALAHQLTVDQIFINNLLIAYADSPTFTALKLDKRPAVLLGMRELRLFKRVAIDFAGRKVLFDISSAGLGPMLLASR